MPNLSATFALANGNSSANMQGRPAALEIDFVSLGTSSIHKNEGTGDASVIGGIIQYTSYDIEDQIANLEKARLTQFT
jgi:hypothetical protein